MVNVGIFYDHLKIFVAIWYNSWPLGIVCGLLLYFFPIWYVWTKKNLATLVTFFFSLTGGNSSCFSMKISITFGTNLERGADLIKLNQVKNDFFELNQIKIDY
jgi:hypothetical protein